MAAIPSPRPVRPKPSVVVAVTVTGAPTASLKAASASPRRVLSFGRLPMSCTATLPTSKPARLTSSRAVRQQRHSRRTRPLVAVSTEHFAKVAQPRGRQQRVTAGMRHNVTVRVAAATQPTPRATPARPSAWGRLRRARERRRRLPPASGGCVCHVSALPPNGDAPALLRRAPDPTDA